MSRATAARSTRPSRTTAFPSGAAAAVERVRLTVVPHRRNRAPRVPFVTLVGLILLAGVVGLLLVNTSLQQASFTTTTLQTQATNLTAREQTLRVELDALRDPQRVAQRAVALGMVLPPSAAILHLPSGRIDGTPMAATPEDGVRIAPTRPVKPKFLEPDPIRVRSRDTSGSNPDREARAGRTSSGAPENRAARQNPQNQDR